MNTTILLSWRAMPCALASLLVLSLLSLALSPAVVLAAASAPSPLWSSPQSVQLSPRGARLITEIEVPVTKEQATEQAQVEFYIPGDAQNLEISINGDSVAQWFATQESLKNLSGNIATQRFALLEEKALLQGKVEALKARINLVVTPTANSLPPEQIVLRDRALDEVLPPTYVELAAQNRLLQKVEARLSSLPESTLLIQKITAQPQNLASDQTKVRLKYSYTLANCGWQPEYRFNALPDSSSVQVTLFAKIWQYSGIDWDNANITLVPQSDWQREPGMVRPWHITTGDEQAAPLPIARANRAMPMTLAASPDMAGMLEAKVQPRQAPQLQDAATFSSWALGKRSLDEGTVQVRLAEDNWQSPLVWLARPSISNAVWLMVRHTLSNVRAWPAGEAAFCIDGAAVGTGMFAPKGDTATIYFGIDPRVTVRSEADPRVSGKEGLLDKRKTWEWAWDYTVFNGRPTPVEVRLEEAAPQAGDKALSVSYGTKPQPQIGPDHTLFWNVSVPAEDKTSLRHSITLSAPQTLKVRPGR